MNLAHTLGWTLVHSLWEIALVALVLFLVGLFLPRSNARLRYGLALAALVLCLAGPIATYSLLSPATPAQAQPNTHTSASLSPTSPRGVVASQPVKLAESAPVKVTLRQRIDEFLPKAVLLWIFGMALMCVRLIGGLTTIQSLIKRSPRVSDPQWLGVLTSISNRLKVKGSVELRMSDRIETPIVVGLLKSVVIFPASALMKLPPSDVEALMAHELAHIRRYDYLVNLCQSIVETVLFFQPAVWWISSVVRYERENCCDDLAITILGNREQYARALLGLEQMRHPVPQLALAANQGSLVSRIKRIVLPSSRPPISSAGWLAATIIAIVAIGLTQRLHAAPQHSSKHPARKLSLKGRVLDSQGHPVAGASVYYTFRNFDTGSSQEVRVTSDIHGYYGGPIPADDFYSVVAERKDLGIGWERFDRELGKIVRLHKVGDAMVRVIDSAGKPVSGIRVGPSNYYDGPWATILPKSFSVKFGGTTTVAGFAKVGGVMSDCYTGFAADDDRYAQEPQIYKNSTDGKPLRVTVFPAYRVNGTVMLDGKAIPGAQIFARTKNGVAGNTRTDQSGRFELKRLVSDKYRVTCRLPDPLRGDWTTHSLEANASTSHIQSCEFRLEKGALLQGKVVDQTGAPASKVMVSVSLDGEDSDGLFVGPIGPDGAFKVRVPAGTHKINQFDRYQTASSTITVRNGETKQVTLTTPAKEDVVEIECKVLDADSKPMEEHILNYGFTDSTGKPQTLTAQTGFDGTATLHPQKSEVSSLWVRAGSDTQDSGRVKVGQAHELTLRMHRITPDTVFGKVVDSSGKPLKGVEVCIMRFFEPGRAMTTENQTTNSRGEYTFTHVYKEATYVVMAQGHGVADSFSPTYLLEPNGHRTQIRSISMPPGHPIHGRIVDQLGKPVPNASVLARNNSMPFGSLATTGKAGTFAIDRLAAGKYTLTIMRDGKMANATASTDKFGTYTLNL